VTALPQPRTEAPAAETPAAGPPRAAYDRRSLALMLLSAVLGASVVLATVGRTWADGTVAFQGTPLHVSVTGSETTGLPGALALVGLASAVAVFAVRGVGRRLVGLLLALAGVGTVGAAVAAATGTAALDRRADTAVGLSRAAVSGVGHTAWPWAVVAGGLLLVVAGLLVLARGRDWPGMSSRYEAPVGRSVDPSTAAASRAETPADLWKALDRGEDPTE
jgi:uncharacterized membrane protein (TIGR02234 family)